MSQISTLMKIKRILQEIEKDIEILKRKSLSQHEKNILKEIKEIFERIDKKITL